MDNVLLLSLNLILCVLVFAFILWDSHRHRKDWRALTVKVKYQTAVHEAGHALMVLRSDRVKGDLISVTTVPDEDSGGRVRFNLMGFPVFVQWEQVIIALGGAAGEYIACGKVDTYACGKDLRDALQMAEGIAANYSSDFNLTPTVETQSLYSEELLPATKSVLNFCMHEALERIKRNERDFYHLVDTLIDRRELTGKQAIEVLSQRRSG